MKPAAKRDTCGKGQRQADVDGRRAARVGLGDVLDAIASGGRGNRGAQCLRLRGVRAWAAEAGLVVADDRSSRRRSGFPGDLRCAAGQGVSERLSADARPHQRGQREGAEAAQARGTNGVRNGASLRQRVAGAQEQALGRSCSLGDRCKHDISWSGPGTRRPTRRETAGGRTRGRGVHAVACSRLASSGDQVRKTQWRMACGGGGTARSGSKAATVRPCTAASSENGST